jgi:uncharacterized protein
VLEESRHFEGLNITFNTNEDCNLSCKYCYEINKKHKVLPFEYARTFIDTILSDPDPIACKGTDSDWLVDKGLILDFIGGDSLMHPELVDEILSYFVYKVHVLNHKWQNKWRASISSNGTLFERKEVRDFVLKWHDVLSLGVSIDGSPPIHDKNRVFAEKSPEGKELGSMAGILKWWPWLQDNCPQATSNTKATCSKDSIPYLYESLKFMHGVLEITYVNQNFIMEDTGSTENDYIVLEDQLRKCGRYVYDNRDNMYWSMIADRFNEDSKIEIDINSKDGLDGNQCGSGAMPALAINGKIYPCFRWLPHTQEQADKSEDYCVGNIWDGFVNKENFVKIREATRRKISCEECIACKHTLKCAFCIGGCYSEFGCFKRTTYICEITKLLSKASTHYWKKIKDLNNA